MKIIKNILKIGKKRLIGYSLIGVLVLLLLLSAYYAVQICRAYPSGNIGNFSENIAQVVAKTNPGDFTFLVVGDVKNGTATFEKLLNICRGDKPAFAVVLGDFVCHAEMLEHKLFVEEMSEERLPFSIFVVPGNHDIDPEGSFHAKEFEEFWGATQFRFAIGNNLFIFLNNTPPCDESGEYLKYLEAALSNKSAAIQNVFVFMHVPPENLNPRIKARGVQGSAKFMDLIKKYGVKYVFAGDHHGYVKTERDGATYIVTGGGGSRLRGEHGHFHHLVRMSVQDNAIDEAVISVEKQNETAELVEQNAVAYLLPFLWRRWPMILGAIAVIVFLMILRKAFLFKRVRKIR